MRPFPYSPGATLRRALALLAIPFLVLAAALPAAAGSAHFVDGTVLAARTGDTLTVSGKEAGLGDEAQVHIVVTATAACVNPGGNKPQAANKETVTAAADFPVQSGHADFSLSLTASFQPSCSPPMSVVYSNVIVSDTTNNITQLLPGVF